MTSPRILVAGIGNIFLCDDAFGVEAVNLLATRPQPDGVRIVDYGIRSYDLAYAMLDDHDAVILVDAAPRGGEPGTLYVVEIDVDDAAAERDTEGRGLEFDAHRMDPVAVLRLVRHLGGRPRRVLLVGCEPATFGDDTEMGLSEPIATALPEAVRLIEEVIGTVRADMAVSRGAGT